MPQTRSRTKKAVLAPAPNWGEDSGDESPLTEWESEDDELEEEEVKSPPPPPPPAAKKVAKQRAAPAPKASTSTPASRTRPATQKMTAKSRKIQAAKERAFLDPPHVVTYNLGLIYEWLKAGQIDLEAEYQRDVVWPEDKQIQLMDSFRHNYPVPFVICTLETVDGVRKRICIDGKQRLTSIYLFFEGKIPFKDAITHEKLYYVKCPGIKGKVMSQEKKTEFYTKTITFQDYQNIDLEQQKDIFNRVQNGVALTPAERLQAITSTTAAVVHEVRSMLKRTDLFTGFQEWGTNRGKDFLILAQIVYLLKPTDKKPTTKRAASKKKSEGNLVYEPTSTRVSTWLHKDEPPAFIEELRLNLMQAFAIFFRIAHIEKYQAAITDNTLSTLEFVLSIYLIHVYKKKMTDCEISTSITRLRKELKRKDATAKWTAAAFKNGMSHLLAITDTIADDSQTLAILEAPLEWDELRADDDDGDPPALLQVLLAAPTQAKKRSRPDPPPEDEMDVDEPPATLLKKRKMISPEVKPEIDDSDSEEEAPLQSTVKARKAVAKKPLSAQVKASTSSAETKLRKSKAPTSTSSSSKKEMQKARSSQHPSLQGIKQDPTLSHSVVSSPTITPTGFAPYAQSMSGLLPRYMHNSASVSGQLFFSNTGQPALSNPEDRLQALRNADSRLHPHRPSGSTSQLQTVQQAELPATVHKLPTPPVQDEPRHTLPPPTTMHSAPPHTTSFSAQAPQYMMSSSIPSLPPGAKVPSSVVAASAGETKKGLLKALSFKRHSISSSVPGPSAAGPSQARPAQQFEYPTQSRPGPATFDSGRAGIVPPYQSLSGPGVQPQHRPSAPSFELPPPPPMPPKPSHTARAQTAAPRRPPPPPAPAPRALSGQGLPADASLLARRNPHEPTRDPRQRP